MSFQDKDLQCKECGQMFQFSAGEQEFFAQKGFQNEPSRCPECRSNRRRQSSGRPSSSGGRNRELYKAICSDCGIETEVPFKPTGERPVYCRECFKNRAI